MPLKFKVDDAGNTRLASSETKSESPPAAVQGPKLTDEQEQAVDLIADWYGQRPRRFQSTNAQPPMTVGGLAGTGKTTIANQLPEYLGVPRGRVAYCAFTGKAASRLQNGQTIHRLIYQPTELHCDECPRLMDKEAFCHGNCKNCTTIFDRRPRIEGYDLIIVDEASMVNASIYKDLISYRVPVLWIGDHGQLPPVKGSFNLMADPVIRLEKIHRQLADSPILALAMHARRTGWVPFGVKGPGVSKRHLNGNDWPLDREFFLCGKNNTRVALNREIRAHRGYPAEHPVPGDRLVCLRNDYDTGVYNGQLAVVQEWREENDPEFWVLRVLVDGEKTPVEVVAYAPQFGAEKTRIDTPRWCALWDYGYALTVHKAQGSEADDLVLVEQPISDKKRWLYTGITRAKRTLEIIAR
jgi:exodeoxyribonuclease-5